MDGAKLSDFNRRQENFIKQDLEMLKGIDHSKKPQSNLDKEFVTLAEESIQLQRDIIDNVDEMWAMSKRIKQRFIVCCVLSFFAFAVLSYGVFNGS